MEFFTRLGSLAIAAALIYVALKLNKSANKKAKNTSIIAGFIAGLALLVTVVGDWMSATDWLGQFAVAVLIVCACIIIVDWLIDKKPDKPALYASIALGMAIVLGAANLPEAAEQIGNGGSQVGEQLSRMGR